MSASAWFYVPSGWPQGAQVSIAWLDGNMNLLSSTSGPVTAIPAQTWTQVLNVNVTSAPGSVYAVISPQLEGTPPASDRVLRG